MGTAGVVALEFVVDLRRGLQPLLEAVGPDQGRGAVHFVEIRDFLGDGNEGIGVVELLRHELLTEHGAELLGGHGLMRARIEQGSGLVLHIRADVVPILRHFGFFEIDFVGDVLVSHGDSPFLFGTKENDPVPVVLLGQDRNNPAVPPGLTLTRPLCAHRHVPALFTESRSVSHTRGNAPFLLALGSPFGSRFPPRFQHPRLSVGKVRELTHSSSTVYPIKS